MRTLSFVGCGRLGKTLGRLFAVHQVFRIHQVFTPHLATANTAVAFIGEGQAIDDIAALTPADVFIIAAPDTAIGDCAERLAATGALTPATIVFHCSGALDSSLLSPCARLGALTASVHPLLSFADPELSVQAFTDSACHCAIEVSSQMDATRQVDTTKLFDALNSAFSQIGGRPFPLATAAKLRYHAAAVIASNYLVTLTEYALATLESAGVARPLGQTLLMPLMQQALNNLKTLSPKEALTGPIARGDINLVWQQQADLALTHPDLAHFYAELANATASLADQPPPFPALSTPTPIPTSPD